MSAFNGAMESNIAFEKTNNLIVIEGYKLQGYKMDSKSNYRGKQLEEKVAALCRLLTNVTRVYLAEPGSELDCVCKVDVVVEFNDGEVAKGFQVKSSKAGADSHLATGSAVGVFYLEGDKASDHPTKMLKVLSEALQAPVKNTVMYAGRYAYAHAKQIIITEETGLSQYQIDALITLGLVKVQGNALHFLP